MTGKETKRLSKVAREFNVGISTIVDFLNKKGFDISSNPNNRISDEAYSMLQKEYSSDISLKKESEKLNLRAHRLKNESVSIEDLKHEGEPEETTESDEEEVIITDLSSNSRPQKAQEEKPIEKEILPENPHHPLIEEKIKVVGKIDLDNISHKPASNKEQQGEKVTTSQPKKSTEIKNNSSEVKNSQAESKVTEKDNPIHKEKSPSEKVISKPQTSEQEKPVIEDKPASMPQAEAKKDTIPNSSTEVEKEPEQVQSAQPKKQEKHSTPEKIILQKKPEVLTQSKNINQPQPSQQKKTSENKERDDIAEEKTTNVPEFIETNVPKIEDEIKVVGKIDLESLNQKTRPAKKSKKQKEEERRERIKVQRDTNKNISAESTHGNGETKTDDSQNHPSKSPSNGGGKFDLQLQKKKVGGTTTTPAEDEEHRKKRRKRISKDGKERVNVATDGRPTPIHPNTDPNRRSKKPPLRPIPGNRRHLVKKEVNEEDVQKQIKDTLARLTSKTKSKGSKYRREKRQAVSEKIAAEQERINEEKNILKATEFVSVNELATMMNVPVTQVIATCMSLGMFVSINQRLDAETLSVVADEFGYKVEFVSAALQDSIEEEVDSEEELITRPPIVTVMGHVDHGKTSLLDYIRKANVVSGEAGGITQHIGAYSVSLESGRKITFLDTPGHEAFTAMRARGAEVTDIAIIIIAADDNIMPQTIEAINHAQAAGVPIVFAINKIDKPGANPDKIKEALANMNLLVEEWGGKYQSQDISAKSGLGVKELLEKVVLEAEMLELKANPEKRAIGSVIESSLDKGRGYVATVLIKSGTLKIGDMVIAGQYYGHVKAMFNERNQHVEKAGPADPVLILGLNGAPQAGDKFNVLENEKEARLIANKREQLQREQGLRTQKHITLDEIGRRIAIGNFQELNLIVKGDVDGSIEALSDSLIKLSTEEIQVNVIHKAVGQISESDVMLATASNAIIIGFQVRPSLSARKIAEKEQIDIRLYSVIYKAIEEIKAAMEGMLSPDIKEEITATVEVIQTFKISKVGTIAGCMVRDGKIKRSSKVRIVRDGIVTFSGELASLKRFKDDVKEVSKGFECGLNLENYNDIKVGDTIECYEEVEVSRKL